MPIRLLFLLWGFIFSKELKKLIKNLFTDSTEYKLAILGMPGSGKTYFLNFLRNKKINVSETTIISKPYDSFDYITRSDKKIVIDVFRSKISLLRIKKRNRFNRINNQRIISERYLINLQIFSCSQIISEFANVEVFSIVCNSFPIDVF